MNFQHLNNTTPKSMESNKMHDAKSMMVGKTNHETQPSCLGADAKPVLYEVKNDYAK